MSWIIGRSVGSTQPSLGRVSLSLNSYQNPQFGMTINKISPSPHPTSRKTIHWIVLLGRVTRGEGIKPLLEITDFGPPARGGHFVLFHSFLPPQPYGTQFHSVHTSPVQLVSLPLPPRRREGKITVTPSLIRVGKLNTLQTNNIKPSPQLSPKKYLNFLKKYYIIY